MKRRLSALIILLANIAILAHAAVPHYHGDDMTATVAHIVSRQSPANENQKDDRCHHEGSHEHDDAAGHCIINDTIAAFACRIDNSYSGCAIGDLPMAIIPYFISFGSGVCINDSDFPACPDPLFKDMSFTAVALRRGPPCNLS